MSLIALSGMVHSVRVKVFATALFHGSLHVDLVNSASDDIEVRICARYYELEEDAPKYLSSDPKMQLLELCFQFNTDTSDTSYL